MHTGTGFANGQIHTGTGSALVCINYIIQTTDNIYEATKGIHKCRT